MFYSAKNTKLTLNGRNILVNTANLSQEVQLDSPIKSNDVSSEKYLPSSPFVGKLQFSYYLTGQDPIKEYLYTNENQRLSGNFAGITFNQGYISNYNFNCLPNSPAIINCDISFFDKLSGSFSPVSLTHKNYDVLNLFNCSIDNLSSYTTNVLTNISQANFSYNCELVPSYKSYGTGFVPYQADRVSIGERSITAEIVSDNTNMNLPLSGDKFGLNITLGAGANTESFGVSGMINSKQLSFSMDDVHSHSIKISQKHLNIIGEINSVQLGNPFIIHSATGEYLFTNRDNSINYVNKIFVDDVLCPNYSVNRGINSDSIQVTHPTNLVNGILRVETPTKTFIYPTPLTFTFPDLIISGLSPNSGRYGTPINISGANFYQISNVNFNGIESRFQNVSPTLIQAVVPYGGLVGKIQVISTKRNLSGFSSGFFYCEPDIDSISPITGMWKKSISILGVNFSGTTSVKFNGFNASGFTVNSNTSITANSPETGAGYARGYITVLTSGGLAKSISIYKPHVPIYSFDPTSGAYFDRINIRTKIDTGYLYPSGNGVKVRFGNIDTVFYPSGYESNSINKTGCLTGQVPIYAIDDYIYLYEPDGVSTYSPNTGKFNVIGEPTINSFSPSVVNQYKNFTPVILGENFKFFFGKPYFFALSGGVNNNVQFYSNIQSNSGTLADTAYIENIVMTGSTGLYSAIIQNYAGSYRFTGALLVKSGINRAFECVATASSTIIASNMTSHASPQLIIDGSTGSYAGIACTTTLSDNSFTITPKNNNIINISYLRFIKQNLQSKTFDSNTYSPNNSGVIKLYQRNNATPVYDSSQILLNDTTDYLSSLQYTGIRTIKIFTPKVLNNNTEYMGISELNIY